MCKNYYLFIGITSYNYLRMIFICLCQCFFKNQKSTKLPLYGHIVLLQISFFQDMIVDILKCPVSFVSIISYKEIFVNMSEDKIWRI